MSTDRLYRVRLDADTFMPSEDAYYPHEMSVRVYGAPTDARYRNSDLLLPEATWSVSSGCMHLTCLLQHAKVGLEVLGESGPYRDLMAAGVIS